MRRKGFTLAEVLITLAVIGVVAALVIPTVLNNAGALQYKSSVKKAAAALNSAIRFRKLRTGNVITGVNNQKDLTDLFKEDLSILNTFGDNKIYTADSISYTFLGSNCEAVDSADLTWSGAACKVLIDVNGDAGPNQESDVENDFRDQYRFVITTSNVIPVKNSFGTRALTE